MKTKAKVSARLARELEPQLQKTCDKFLLKKSALINQVLKHELANTDNLFLLLGNVVPEGSGEKVTRSYTLDKDIVDRINSVPEIPLGTIIEKVMFPFLQMEPEEQLHYLSGTISR